MPPWSDLSQSILVLIGIPTLFAGAIAAYFTYLKWKNRHTGKIFDAAKSASHALSQYTELRKSYFADLLLLRTSFDRCLKSLKNLSDAYSEDSMLSAEQSRELIVRAMEDETHLIEGAQNFSEKLASCFLQMNEQIEILQANQFVFDRLELPKTKVIIPNHTKELGDPPINFVTVPSTMSPLDMIGFALKETADEIFSSGTFVRNTRKYVLLQENIANINHPELSELAKALTRDSTPEQILSLAHLFLKRKAAEEKFRDIVTEKENKADTENCMEKFNTTDLQQLWKNEKQQLELQAKLYDQYGNY